MRCEKGRLDFIGITCPLFGENKPRLVANFHLTRAFLLILRRPLNRLKKPLPNYLSALLRGHSL